MLRADESRNAHRQGEDHLDEVDLAITHRKPSLFQAFQDRAGAPSPESTTMKRWTLWDAEWRLQHLAE